jgi:hypothetical protein
MTSINRKSNLVDITGTLYVLKDTTVTFKAAPDPPNSTFPANMPTWGGTGGATGTGATKQITFNTTSTNTSDYKTVIAGNPTAVTVNVVVYELIGVLDPVDYFVGRSQSSYGVGEEVALNYYSTPGLTEQQIGGVTWRRVNGNGTIPSGNNGITTYTASDTPNSEDLKIEVVSGPSKGNGTIYNKVVVAPSGAVAQLMVGTNVRHNTGQCHVGMNIEAYLLPTDVSFSKAEFYEGIAYGVGSGYYAAFNCPSIPPPSGHACIHPQGITQRIKRCNIVTGCHAFDDFVDTGPTIYAPPCTNGDFYWDIPWNYIVGSGGGHFIQNARHHQFTTNPDKTSIEKAGVGPHTRRVGDPTTYLTGGE